MVLLTALAVAFPLVYVVALDQGCGRSVFFAIVGLVAASALGRPHRQHADHAHGAPPGAAPPGLLRGHPDRPPDHGGRPHLAGPARGRAGSAGSPGGPLSGQSRPQPVLRPAHRFPRCSRAHPAGRRRVGRPGARRHRGAQRTRTREDRPGIFYLFHRPRVWNPARPGVDGLRAQAGQARAVQRPAAGGPVGRSARSASAPEPAAGRCGGAASAFSDIVGDRSILGSIRYVITLDTDTQLPRDAAHTLIGNMAHPLNRPVYDAKKGRVVDGYAILQPRASISLTSTSGSRFTRLFAGEAGIDPYTREISDVYQDLFGEGSFVGKGIYDVEAFSQAVQRAVPGEPDPQPRPPRGRLRPLGPGGRRRPHRGAPHQLRHGGQPEAPLDQGRLATGRLAAPPRARARTASGSANPLSLLSVWKLFDNLRRSLVPAALVALCVGGWLWGPGPSWLWPLLVAGALFLPPLVTAAHRARPQARGAGVAAAPGPHRQVRWSSPLLRALLGLMLLPYDALVYLDAILRSAVEHARHPARAAALVPALLRAAGTPAALRASFLLEMWIAPALAVVLARGADLRAQHPAGRLAVRRPPAGALAGLPPRRLVDQQAGAAAVGRA